MENCAALPNCAPPVAVVTPGSRRPKSYGSSVEVGRFCTCVVEKLPPRTGSSFWRISLGADVTSITTSVVPTSNCASIVVMWFA